MNGVSFVSPSKGYRLFDNCARYYCDISGEEFLRQWDAGELDSEDSAAMRVAMLIPFARLRMMT